jgi:hypothetical protein
VDAGGNLIDSVAYKDADPWPTEPDGNGPSLELKDAGSDNNDGVNYRPVEPAQESLLMALK